MVKTFTKRPVRVQAVQWTGYNHKEIQEFTESNCEWRGGYADRTLVIHTLEGDHYASVGDWIIRGIKGEYYPCKPDIFERTYEEVAEIEHLVDVTCSWDEGVILRGDRLYAIGPGFTHDDLTPYELQLLEKSEEYEKKMKGKIPPLSRRL